MAQYHETGLQVLRALQLGSKARVKEPETGPEYHFRLGGSMKKVALIG